MEMTLHKTLLLAALALGSAVAEGPTEEKPTLEMQVEEPADFSAPPIDPEHEAAWKATSGPALSRSERAALETRRKQVEAMAFQVREKRKALEHAGLDERAERARDLEALILDGVGDDARKLKQLEKLLEKQTAIQEKQLEKQEKRLQKTEKKIEQQIKEAEKKQQRLEKELEKQLEKTEKGKGGKGPKSK